MTGLNEELIKLKHIKQHSLYLDNKITNILSSNICYDNISNICNISNITTINTDTNTNTDTDTDTNTDIISILKDEFKNSCNMQIQRETKKNIKKVNKNIIQEILAETNNTILDDTMLEDLYNSKAGLDLSFIKNIKNIKNTE